MKPYVAIILAISLAAAESICLAQAPATAPAATTVSMKQQVDAAVSVFIARVAASPDDDPLLQKMKERHNTAVRFLETRIASYRNGTADAAAVFEAAQGVGSAKLELAASGAERAAVARQILDLLRLVESRVEQQFQAGVTPESTLLRAQLARLDAEVELLKLERATSAAPTTRPK